MIRNELLMQFQADILDRPVVAPPIAETSALGAAYAAGLAVGFWGGLDELRAMDSESRRWTPSMDAATRQAGIARWHKGLERTLAGWSRAMKAAVRERYGTPDVVHVGEIERPTAGRRSGAGPSPGSVRQPGRPRRDRVRDRASFG